MPPCIHPISDGTAAIWGSVGALVAFAIVWVAPAAIKASDSGAVPALKLWNILMYLLLLLIVAGTGAVVALIGNPAAIRDALVWGLGAWGLIGGFVATVRRQ